MNDGTPSSSRDHGPFPDVVPDARLADEVRRSPGGTPASRPVGELLDRHWESVFSYARLCTDGVGPAGMLTTAAFTRLFGDCLHEGGPDAAWRPHLLVTVRRMAGEWLTDGRRDLLSPALRADVEGADGPRAEALLPPEGRRLLARAFQRLPEPARCLLWHGETEGERLAVPAALLGLPVAEAPAELRRARERLRDTCLELHLELAPDGECRRYHRILDVSVRRGGGDLDPDLRAHMARCGHCRTTADQLNRFNGSLAVPLAEAVLGWGARPYAASRRPRTAAATAAPAAPAAPPAPAPPAATAPAAPAPPAGTAAGRDGQRLAGRLGPPPGSLRDVGGDGTAPVRESIVEFDPRSGPLLPPVPPRPPGPPPGPLPPVAAPPGATRERSGAPADRGTAGTPSRRRAPARAGRGRSSRRGARPATAGGRSSRRAAPRKGTRRAPSRRTMTLAALGVGALILVPLVVWAVGKGFDGGDGTAGGTGARGTPRPHGGASRTGDEGRADGDLLRNTATGLCAGTAAAKAAEGVETRLVPCAGRTALTLVHERDGQLRTATGPRLCLDSRLGYVIRLARCPAASAPAAENVRYDLASGGRLVARRDPDLVLVPAAPDGASSLVLKPLDDDDRVQRWTFVPASSVPRTHLVDWGSASGGPPTPSATRPGR